MPNLRPCFPNGKLKALTLSYDDGLAADRRLVAICNRHGLRGTFNLNSTVLGRPGMITAREVPTLYAGHEVASHTARHPHLPRLSPEAIAAEIREDQERLRQIWGQPVRGIAYPYGEYDDRVAAAVPALGLEYGRTTRYNGRFDLPADLYRWGGSCFHFDRLLETGELFQALNPVTPALMLVWGHSWEIEETDRWDLLETFAARLGPDAQIWHATNIAVAEYLRALAALKLTAGGRRAENPGAVPVWVLADGKPCVIPAQSVCRFAGDGRS